MSDRETETRSRNRSRSPRRSRSRSPAPRKPKSYSGLKFKNTSRREEGTDTRDSRDDWGRGVGGRRDRRDDGFRDRHDDRDRGRDRNGDRDRDRDRRDHGHDRHRPRGSDRDRGDRDRHRDRDSDRRRSREDKDKDKDKTDKKPAAAAPKPAVPGERMITVTVNDRLGTKAQIPCLPSDPVKLLKALVAAQIGRPVHEIMLKRQGQRPFHDSLSLADYEISDGVQIDLELNTGD